MAKSIPLPLPSTPPTECCMQHWANLFMLLWLLMQLCVKYERNIWFVYGTSGSNNNNTTTTIIEWNTGYIYVQEFLPLQVSFSSHHFWFCDFSKSIRQTVRNLACNLACNDDGPQRAERVKCSVADSSPDWEACSTSTCQQQQLFSSLQLPNCPSGCCNGSTFIS